MLAWLEKVGYKESITDAGFTTADIDKLTEASWECPGMYGLLDIAPFGLNKSL